MKINVKVKIQSKKERVEKIDEGNFQVYVNCPPIEGRANERVIELFSDYFNVAKSQISIAQGLKSKNKVLEIDEK